MTYGLSRALFVEDGPAIQAANSAATRTSTRFLLWRKLDAKNRLEVVECALKSPANDCIDSYPLAL